MSAGNAAGGHFDLKSTKSLKGPDGAGHEGDLPKLLAKGGKIEETVAVPRVLPTPLSGNGLDLD
jgi:Cu-Zn family superoxide dismutase